MNLIFNVLHMLLMLSPSMSTSLPDISQTFIWTLLYQLWHSSQTNPWVLFMLPYLECWDCRIYVDCSARSCACPLCCVFLAKLGLIHFNLELAFTFPPFEVLEPLILIPWLTASVTPFLLTKLSYLPLCDISVKELPYINISSTRRRAWW